MFGELSPAQPGESPLEEFQRLWALDPLRDLDSGIGTRRDTRGLVQSLGLQYFSGLLLYVRTLRGAQRRNKCKAARLNFPIIPSPPAQFPKMCVSIYTYIYKMCVCIYIYIYIYIKVWFWLYLEAGGVLVPRSGTELVPSAVRAWSPNHWTAREVPTFLKMIFLLKFS